MQALGFYLALPFLYLISLLPFPVLYLFSDLLFVLAYYVIGYRKKVVLQNLKNAFPEKTDGEVTFIQKKFYRHLCDLCVEIVKTLTISKKAMAAHCKVNDRTVQFMNKLFEQKKSAILVLGHQGNWEWASHAFSLQCKYPLYGLYQPLENKYFDAMILGLRTRFGTILIAMQDTFREMLKMKERVYGIAFIADQTPSPENAFWLKFLNQDTPVFKGTEIIARKLNLPVVYMDIKKIKRGYYEITSEMLSENPESTSEEEITKMHTEKLESSIKRRPETWLWSHRRWKHKRS